jgi:hypothetical protein
MEEIMNVRCRSFGVLVALAAVAAMPAWGQAASTANGTQSAAPIPDFSGIWGHQYLGFEPPLSGPGPVANRSRLPSGESNGSQLVGDYTNPILKPHAAEIVKKYGEISLAGVAFPSPRNQCQPHGVPFILWDFEMQMLQQPDKITILHWADHQVRHVRLNQPHPAHVEPSWYGDSVGHYEGDTLVIDTVGIKVGPYSMVDMFGTPHTGALHVVERYRLLDSEAAKKGQERGEKENRRIPADASTGDGVAVDPDYKGKGLQLEFTVEDEGVFTMAWSATETYRRILGEWPEHVCAENPHVYYGNDTAVPTADKPDF